MSVRRSGPAGLQLRPVLLGCSNSLGTTASFLGLSKARAHYVPARPCQFIAICLSSLPSQSPVCYLLLTIAIYAMRPPPREIEGVRGIHPLTTIIPISERDMRCALGIFCA